MNLKYIFKILDKVEWVKAKNSGFYSGSSKDLEDGYIHFSGEDQVLETLEKYFSKQTDLILLKVHTLNLDNLLWEKAFNGDLYPHLCSTLDLKNVRDQFELVLIQNEIH